ncbi:MAG TPA: hypothetical protein VEA79_08175 [Phenylobacterium sp.]|nr:hypothetical protein [Phenylobacterium sp.]
MRRRLRRRRKRTGAAAPPAPRRSRSWRPGWRTAVTGTAALLTAAFLIGQTTRSQASGDEPVQWTSTAETR